MVDPEKASTKYVQAGTEIEKIFADINRQHPQHQGIGEAEIESMLKDNDTACTEITTEGSDLVPLPHIAHIRHFDWLNTDFYQRRFPDAFNSANLMNFIDLPGVKPGEQVVQKIQSLASSSGVIVFETASCDPEAKDRILEIVSSSGVDFQPAELIGTQTYFVGQSKLLTVEPSEAPQSLGEAYDTIGEGLGLYDPQTKTGVVLQHRVPEEAARYMYDFYEEAYKVINDHPCRQGLSPDEFYDMAVRDEDVDKLIYFNRGVPEALYLACNDLTKLSWVNSQYYKNKYPAQYTKGQLVWFPGIATDPRPEVAGHNTQYMINLMAKLVVQGRNDFVALMDFCDMNAAWLPGYLESEINKTDEARISIEPIATQQYWGLQLQSAA